MNWIEYWRGKKGLDPSVPLTDWQSSDGRALTGLLFRRRIRGYWQARRFGSVQGWMLCERGVRVYYPGHIHAGTQFSLEEGCEVVGLSKQGVRFGNRCTVGRGAIIRPTNVLLDEAGEGMVMGDHSNIGPLSYIGCSGFVDIGHRVLMGPRVNILAENHRFEDGSTIKSQGVLRKPIRIEDDCWIGAGATILAGVTVGASSVVAAGAVVTRDVPSGSVVGGVPARPLRL